MKRVIRCIHRFVRWSIFRFIPLRCPCCGKWGTFATVEKRRTLTRYVDDHRNFLTSCPECLEHHDEIMRQQWAEYYSSVVTH
jgi:hypothetical protein